MLIETDRSGTIEGFSRLFKTMSENKTIKGLLILACDDNGFRPEDVDGILKQSDIPVLGGIFPEIIRGKEKLKKGTIIVGLPVEPSVYVIGDLSQPGIEYETVIDREVKDYGGTKTMIVLVDGLSKRVNALIKGLFNVFGLDFNYIGGGAGSLSFNQAPCLFTNKGLIQDSAVIGLLDIDSGIGVNHGWESIKGPFRVTKSDRNTIFTLDGKPAFEVYRKIVHDHSGQLINGDNFFEIAKCYPFGINKLGKEKIVRDPLQLGENGEMICVGEVPAESYVDILTGDVDSLVAAAGDALTMANSGLPDSAESSLTLFIDCISRVLFLEDQFSREIEAVKGNGSDMVGALTLGEIANNGKDYLEFYNKTAVVGVLG